jgi:hypothetical protein
LRPQEVEFRSGQLEHEIAGESFAVALDSFVQALGGDSIHTRQVGIQDDPLAADFADEQINWMGWC